MVQSVELVVDEELRGLVREEWDALLGAGLPSQARHAGASNAPHITLGVADRMDERAELALADVDYGVGGPMRLGGLLVFSGRTSVLSRSVVPSEGLLRTHTAVQAVVGELPGSPHNTAPGRWTPHVTLARRLDAAQLAAALGVLADRPRELIGSIGAARRWDGDSRVTWDIAGVS